MSVVSTDFGEHSWESQLHWKEEEGRKLGLLRGQPQREGEG